MAKRFVKVKSKYIDKDDAIRILIEMIDRTDKKVYVVKSSNRSPVKADTQTIIMLLCIDGEIKNISSMAAMVCDFKVKGSITPYIIVPMCENSANFAVRTLQRELYRDVFFKEKLIPIWI